MDAWSISLWTQASHHLRAREREPYTDSLLRGLSNSWYTAKNSVTGPVENKISGHYQDGQILWVKPISALPSVTKKEKKMDHVQLWGALRKTPEGFVEDHSPSGNHLSWPSPVSL